MNSYKFLKNNIISVLKDIKLTVFLYFLNIFFALIIAFPFKSLMEKAFSTSKISEKLLNEFDFSVFIDFIVNYSKEIGTIFSNLLPVFLIYYVFNIFLSGGIISIFKSDEHKYNSKSFFYNCAEYFPRLMKLFLLSFAFSILLLIIFSGFAAILFNISMGIEIKIISLLVLALIFAGFFILIMDFGRVMIIEHDSRKIFSTFLKSILFVIKNTGRILAFILPLFFLFVIFVFGYFYIRNIFIVNSLWIIIFVFFIQQIFIILRVYIRIVLYSCYYSFYKTKLL
jgi:hypothetical protein